MKNTPSLKRVAFLALALSTAGLTAALAQDTPPSDSSSAATPTPAPAAGKHKGGKTKTPPVLTPDEMTKMKTAHDAALAANADLQKESDDLTAQRSALKAQGDNASDADKAALQTKADAFQKKIHEAMLKIDPTLAPLIAKVDAARAAKEAAAASGGTPTPAPAK